MKSRLVLALIVVVVGACEPQVRSPSPEVTVPPDATTTTTTVVETTTTLSPPEGVSRFRECLGEAGIAVEPIPFDAQGRPRLDLVLRDVDFSRPENANALDDCSVYLTSGPLALERAPLIAEGVVDALNRFSECVRLRGVPEFPAPVEDFRGVGSPFRPEEIPYSVPVLGAALEDCRHLLYG